MSAVNKKRFYHLLDKYPIDVIHMEYPGDLYGKTFLASFIPLLVKNIIKRIKKIYPVTSGCMSLHGQDFYANWQFTYFMVCGFCICTGTERQRSHLKSWHMEM